MTTVGTFLRLSIVGLVVGTLGCGGGSDLMPLEVGKTWNYIVRAKFSTYVAPVKVTRRLSVASVPGFELTSILGSTRLAWSGDALVTDRLVNTQFTPALPLLYRTGETSERLWKGRVVFVDRSAPNQVDFLAGKGLVTATQSQKPDNELEYNGMKLHCIRSTIHMKTAAREIELLTWFAPGIGIVKQEQRTDGTLLVSLSLVPK